MGKVLVVDDDAALRRLMHLELSDTHEIIDSGEPEQALALAFENKPDAILLDLRMPKYSGYELLKTFTSLSRTQRIPVIVVSGDGGGPTKTHCKELGAVGYFEKPIDFDALRTCLKHVAKPKRHIARAEVRVQLHVSLKLCGMDRQGNKFAQLATTEDVSVSGFLCCCDAEIPIASIVDVYLAGSGEDFAGKAEIVHSHVKHSMRHYGCRFTEKSGPWVLQ